MLLVRQNGIPSEWHPYMGVEPLKYVGDVIVVFDPSKTNMAMIVGTPDGNILDAIEFSGNNRKRGPIMDTTVYCEEVRCFLKSYLQSANLYYVAVEAAITKRGMSYHHSNMTLTEIRSNLLNFFMEEFSIRVIEVNNWSWKSATLPQGYRSRSEKGSKRYFMEQMASSPFAYYYEADITDCICIYWYVCASKCATYQTICNKAEPAQVEYKYSYYSAGMQLASSIKAVPYNPAFTLVENLNFYSNRFSKPFVMEVPISAIDVNDVYGKAALFKFEDISADTLKVVAARS